ncbi:dihydrofolate reductase family protein [Pseudarthrobacter sp. NPDC092439]|uniref:dihydrofolate reductase family protein n=1 Tax=unclassified Pseudarthrobacter TaxID=2647000 RepID=UPI0038276A32
MRKIILMMSLSVDGFFERPGRDISWHRVDEELHQHFNDELRAMGAFLSGRVTHELMADFWPTADQAPDAPPVMAEFAGIWRDKPKYVFSRTLTSAGWNTTVIPAVVPEQIAELKVQPGGDLVLGGANLSQAFLRLGLVDEYRLYIHPVVVGEGQRLFRSPDFTADLELAGTRAFGNGVVLLQYRRGGD